VSLRASLPHRLAPPEVGDPEAPGLVDADGLTGWDSIEVLAFG
jgi:hypothetical protein